MGLYEEIGGADAVNAAVDVFYRKVLKDDRIRQFFNGVDMARQSAKQKAFLTMVFGGPAHYTGLDMRKGHAHLVERGLNDSHFDAVMEHLGQPCRSSRLRRISSRRRRPSPRARAMTYWAAERVRCRASSSMATAWSSTGVRSSTG